MKGNRKIIVAVNQVKMDDEDHLDVLFWLNKTPAERLAEVYRLRQGYFTQNNNVFPQKIEKVFVQRSV